MCVTFGGRKQSAAYRFAKQYDCMDLPNAHDPNDGNGVAPGTFDSASNSDAGTRDMVATLDAVTPMFKEFDGKREREKDKSFQEKGISLGVFKFFCFRSGQINCPASFVVNV